MTELTDAVEKGLGPAVADTCQFVSIFLSGMIVSFTYKYDVALVLLSATPIVAMGGNFLMKATTEGAEKTQAAYASASGIASEAIGAARTVFSFNGQAVFFNRYTGYLSQAEEAGIKATKKAGFANGLLVGNFQLSNAIAVLYGVNILANQLEKYRADGIAAGIDWSAPTNTTDPCGEAYFGMTNCATDYQISGAACFTGGTVLVSLLAQQFAGQGLGQAGPSIQAFAKARQAAYEIIQLIKRVPPIDDFSEAGQEIKSVEGKIELSNVEFSYPARPDQVVMNGFNLVVEAGQTVALCGASGSGKSTTIQLVERFYDPAGGTVMLDGQDIKTLNLSWLRQQIGLVSQEPTLFSGTIAENIAYGKPGSSREEVEAAARSANAHDFILSFPDGYDTDVGSAGTQLSGGQKQRVAIARAIVKNPSVLLLDEATSALDNESEKVVQQALDELMKTRKRTTIVIAHRLSTIQGADKIVVVESGRAIEEGTHSELLAKGGAYAALQGAQVSTATETGSNTVGKKDKEFDAANVAAEVFDPEEKAARQARLDKEAEDSVKANKSRIWAMQRPDTCWLTIGSVGALSAGAAFPMVGWIWAEMVVIFYSPDPVYMREQSYLYAAGFTTVGIFCMIAITFQWWGFAVAGEHLTTKLREGSFRATMYQDIGWLDLPDHSTGALVSRLATDATLVRAVTGETLGQMAQVLGTLSCGYAIAFYMVWQAALLSMAFLPLLAMAGAAQWALVQGGQKSAGGQSKSAGEVVGQTIISVRTIKAFTMAPAMLEKFKIALAATTGPANKAGFVRGLAFGMSQAVIMVANAVQFYYGYWLVEQGECTFNQFFVAFMAIFMGSFSLGAAMQNATDQKKAAMAVKNIFDLIDFQSSIEIEDDNRLRPANVEGKIELSNVEFSYPARPDQVVMNGFNLVVEAGQTVALCGASGSGKSTTIQLVERFYDPAGGTVMLDGQDIKTLNLSWLRQQIGLVSQEPTLFSGTIAENIAYGKPGSSREEVEAAARSANAHDFILSFPDGYDTDVGSAGTQLSGGQKQRVAIARAIVKNPSVLLLDEATSALDNESEKVVQQALDELMKTRKRTTIVIAHRLSTIQGADKIVVVESGRAIEEGTHSELLAKGGAYAALQGAHN